MSDNVLAQRLADEASEALEPLYRLLESIAEDVLRSRPPRAPLTEAHFSGLQRRLAEVLHGHHDVWGMGFIAAPFVVEGKERYLAWWQRRADDRVARLRLNFDPTSVDVYDYLQMDFYQLAQRGQARVAYGPYVDYSGSDMYTITATVPVVAEGVFLGIAGADLVVGEVERKLLAVLRQTERDAVVVNTERRVLAANTPRWFVGSRLPEMPKMSAPYGPQEFGEVAEMPLGTGWVVAIAR
ncbi:PDC sensor domain-containing protein [Mycolicibacterium goodii]|uniref:Cache domain-containing protein n=1 Tax=Mycolicibacterium goodii TaxID=134601 RepID=A0ABS6HQH6_MYCGD|nr:cache domain-containing protein [Mycolicibacterium goodii]MBU8824880.1 cache domain-containing protein [Mycolicibacterium goodii]MBU8839879.1 cache domain-containing protein [Mycolicibacterium goodii]